MDAKEVVSRAESFFRRVLGVLKERNKVRGDSFLNLDLTEFGTFVKNKGERVKEAV